MANTQDFREQMANVFAATRHGVAALSEQLRLASEQFRQSFAELQKIAPSYDFFIGESIKLLGDLREAVQRISLVIADKEIHQVLMTHGWVFPWGVPVADIERIVSLFSHDPDEADRIMCNWFDDMAEDIRDSLIDSFPSREHILRDAFEAHKTNKFNLSIPVFLAQADGMWKERCEKHLFTRERDMAIKSLANDHADSSLIRHLALALLNPTFPLFISERNRPPDFAGLNRHQVVHGESLDYGTRTNSLKAMAFLEYCGMILPDLPDE